MKKFLFVAAIQIIAITATSQDLSSFQKTLQSLNNLSVISDSTQRKLKTEEIWTSLQAGQYIPLVEGDSVAFLYRGKSKAVEWMGDFNAWGYEKTFNNKGRLIEGTDVWIMKASFPKDSRLDYKIVLNGTAWILDPDNSHQQWSGVGGGSPNSELRMPEWKEDPVLQPRTNIAHGTVRDEILFNSKTLGYQITYSVYLPAGIDPSAKLPSLYVTDGYEYLQPKLGNMATVLDNLLADKKIKPLIAIFIDHREPVNRSNNKRMDELSMNPKYLDFFMKEFIPFIQTHYPVDTAFTSRGILGTSMGGLTAAYFAFSKPGVFGMAGIQSPAFWIRPQIFTLCTNADHPIKVSMTSGLISDASEGSRKMKDILQTNACDYHYKEVNDGHSWGNWRNLIDDVLIDLYGK